MSRIHSLVYLLPQLCRTLFTRPSTVRYPFGPLELPAYYRGSLEIDVNLCRGCGLCARDCPALALELERTSGHGFRLVLHQDRCAYCGQCAASCKFAAIRVTNDFIRAAPRREGLSKVLVTRDDDADG